MQTADLLLHGVQHSGHRLHRALQADFSALFFHTWLADAVDDLFVLPTYLQIFYCMGFNDREIVAPLR